MGVSEDAAALFAKIEPSEPLEVVLLMRRTGAVLAAWSRDGLSPDVVSVMAATMLGSIATMGDALGRPEPERVAVETEDFRVLALSAEPRTVLVLVAPKAEPIGALNRAARRILDGIVGAGRMSRKIGTEIPAGTPPPTRRSSR